MGFVGEENKVDVSIIILTYNQKNYIRQCIDSVLEQRFTFSAEIIIGDDCSSDGTQNILMEYKETHPFLQLILRKSNIGATANAYDLSCRMRGKYYAYLEGDDFWCDKDKLGIQYDYLVSHPDISGCYHECNIVDETGNILHKPLYWISHKKVFTLSDFDGVKIPGHSSTWMRKNLFQSTSIDFSAVYKFNKNIGDRTIILIFLSNGNFERINRKMSCYRLVRKGTNKSLTSKVYNGLDKYLFEYRFTEQLESLLKQFHSPKVDLENHKNEILAGLLVNSILSNSQKYRQAFSDLYSKSKNKFFTCIEFPRLIFVKALRRIIYLQ